MAGLSPTQRTLKWYRDQGLLCGIVERFIPSPKHPGGGFRSDYLGFIDIIAIGPDGIVGVQSCGQDFSGHHKKITEERREELQAWLEAGGKFLLIGWRRLKVKRGGKAMTWQPRIKEYTLETLNADELLTGGSGTDPDGSPEEPGLPGEAQEG